MSGVKSPRSLDEVARLFAGGGHVTRLRILVALSTGTPSSPKEIAAVLSQPLGDVSYHMRRLAEFGLVQLVRREPRRGAFESFYTLTGDGRLLLKLAAAAQRVAGSTT